MATTILTPADVQTRSAVVSQLDWDPEVDASAVGVAAHDGVVTLTGDIDSYSGKLAAERAAKHVRGVRAVANDIAVRPRHERNDTDIAHDVVTVMRLRDTIPANIQAAVHGGYVTLTGEARALFERRAAEQAVCHIRGVRGVRNYIEVAPDELERDVRRRIVEALHRNAAVDAQHIAVQVVGGTVTLQGKTTTWVQRDAAEHAASAAPGVITVDNRIEVQPLVETTGEIC
jgi:osmotically-inducible protein OsmY